MTNFCFLQRYRKSGASGAMCDRVGNVIVEMAGVRIILDQVDPLLCHLLSLLSFPLLFLCYIVAYCCRALIITR